MEATRDGSLTSNLLVATPATPATNLRTPLPRVYYIALHYIHFDHFFIPINNHSE